MLRTLLIFTTLTIFIFVILTRQISNTPASANDISRLAGIIAVARYNMLNIDKTVQRVTVDKVYNDGKFYSSKPPLLNYATGILVKYVFLLKPEFINNDVIIYQFSTSVTTVTPLVLIFIVFLYLIYRNLNYLQNINKKIILTCLFSLFLVFGTLLFVYSRHLNNHIIVTFIQLIIFTMLLYKEKINGICAKLNSKIRDKLPIIIMGFLLTALFVSDETYGLITIPCTSIYLMYDSWSKSKSIKEVLFIAIYLLIGSIPLTLSHFYLSYLQFSTILPPQLFPEKYLTYEGSRWVGVNQARENLNEPLILRIFNYSFGTYGFFLYQPLLLVPFLNRKNYEHKSRPFILFVANFILYLLFNAIMQPNYGGSAFGPRRFLPFIPILFYYAILEAKNFTKRSLQFKTFFILTFVLTFVISWIGYQNPWTNWNLYDDSTGKHLYFPLVYTILNLF